MMEETSLRESFPLPLSNCAISDLVVRAGPGGGGVGVRSYLQFVLRGVEPKRSDHIRGILRGDEPLSIFVVELECFFDVRHCCVEVCA
jgi:hypothetical protein